MLVGEWLHVELGEIDQALAKRTIHLGRPNVRAGRCRVLGCWLPIPSGKGRHLWINSRDRGLICVNHEHYIIQTAHAGKEEL